jgi:hypothetical protein
VLCFDENFNRLSGNTPNYVSPLLFPNLPTDTGLYYWAAGDVYIGSAATLASWNIVFRDEVKHAWIGIGSSGDANVRTKGFSIWGFLPELTSSGVKPFHETLINIPRIYPFPDGGDNPGLKAPAKPINGAFQPGAFCSNTASASGATPGWVCVSRVDTAMRVAASATETTLEVNSTTGMAAADVIGIQLDDLSWHWTSVASVTDGDTLVLAAGIPASRSAPVGAPIYTNRWIQLANNP